MNKYLVAIIASVIILGVLSTTDNAFSAIFTVSKDISSEDTIPLGITFNSDGTKMFIVGGTGLDILEYNCGTGFDLTTCVYDAGADLDISGQTSFPEGIQFNTDGTKLFTLTRDGGDGFAEEYSCTAFDVSTCTYSGDGERLDLADSQPKDLAFNSDGTKLFYVGASGGFAYEYACVTPFDISGCTYSGDGERLLLTGQDSSTQGIAWSNDGTKMFFLGDANNFVYEYACTAFDVSTCTYSGDGERFSISVQETSPSGLDFNSDGTKMFIIGFNSDEVHEYSLPTAFDVSSSNTAPTLSLTGDATVNITVGATYSDDGATATDAEDDNATLTAAIVVGGLPIDTSVVGGPFTVTYDVTDSGGLDAPQITRTVNVIIGDAPVLTLSGEKTLSVPFGSSYTDDGATCEDTEDGDLTSSIVTTGTIDTGSPGEQTIQFSCTDASSNTVEDTRTVTVLKSGGGSGERAKTAPTSGLDWNTFKPVVEGGIVANGVTYDIDDNWHTDFVLQKTVTGTPNTFTTKTFAQNGGLYIQEIAFGIPNVGEYEKAEALVEVWYNYDKTIDKVTVVQKTEVIDVDRLQVTTDQVKCREDASAMCYETSFSVMFREPLKSDVFAIKSFDMSRRSMMPTYLNDGLDVYGSSLNPMKTMMIPGPEKYEGLIKITQSEKYSQFWHCDDGRIFEMYGISDSVKLASHEVSRDADTGKINTRQHSEFAAYKDGLAQMYKYYFDSEKLQKEIGDSFAYEVSEIDSRTQFLMDNDLMHLRN